MRKLLSAIVISAIVLTSLGMVVEAKRGQAKPSEFCLTHPGHPQCPAPTPTPTPVATPSPTPSPSPTPVATPTPTPVATPIPTPTPTPVPTPVPTPTPTPIITPTPVPTPSPTPTPVNSYTVPATINRTGTADASAALNQWIASVPNGSTLVFNGGIYRLDDGLLILNRHDLHFVGNGAELRANGAAGVSTESPFALWGLDSGIKISGFTIVGNNPTGLYNPDGAHENQQGITIYGATDVEIYDNNIHHTWGDCVYITNSEPGGSVYPKSEDIHIHDNSCSYIGRMGIAVISAARVTVENNSFDQMSLDVLDIEPDWPAPRNSVSDVMFRNNTIGSYAHSDLYRSMVMHVVGNAQAPVNNVTMDGNVITEGRQVNARNSAGGVTARADRPGRNNIRITNNFSNVPGPGYMLDIENTNGVVITGNTQPLTSGQFAYLFNNTNVTYDGQH